MADYGRDGRGSPLRLGNPRKVYPLVAVSAANEMLVWRPVLYGYLPPRTQ
jgi:hypothetical protein